MNGHLRTVLVVDDASDCASTLELALSPLAEIEVRAVASVEEALAVLECGKVAAVITDVQLPGLSGMELLSRIRAHPDWRVLPVLVISADPHRGTPGAALRLGADAYFAKPFSPGAVRRKLEELMYAKSSP